MVNHPDLERAQLLATLRAGVEKQTKTGVALKSILDSDDAVAQDVDQGNLPTARPKILEHILVQIHDSTPAK